MSLGLSNIPKGHFCSGGWTETLTQLFALGRIGNLALSLTVPIKRQVHTRLIPWEGRPVSHSSGDPKTTVTQLLTAVCFHLWRSIDWLATSPLRVGKDPAPAPLRTGRLFGYISSPVSAPRISTRLFLQWGEKITPLWQKRSVFSSSLDLCRAGGSSKFCSSVHVFCKDGWLCQVPLNYWKSKQINNNDSKNPAYSLSLKNKNMILNQTKSRPLQLINDPW